MKPGALAVGATIVLAAVIALYVAMRSDDPSVAPAARANPVPKITQADPGKAGKLVQSPSITSPPQQSVRRSPPVTDYMVGGALIRDHRSGYRTPLDLPSAIHPPAGRKIPSQLTSDVAQKVRAVMTECVMNLPSEARGTEPRLDGTILISIKEGLATITSATVQLRDVSADAAPPVKQCIEQKSVGVATSAGNEPDVSGYAITVAFRVP